MTNYQSNRVEIIELIPAMPMKKWSIAFILILSMLFTGFAAAQEAPTIDTLEVDLWPEYDRPDMLVIYRIELSPDVSPPVELSFRIPVEAGEPHAVAVRDPNGALLTAPYERSVEGDWATITLIATMPAIQLEYYDPQIDRDGNNREFLFTWPGDYAVDSLSIQLQQPFDATQINTIPAASIVSPGSDSLSYHNIELGPQAAGVSTNLTVTYVKASDTLSVESQPVQPISPITTNNISGRTNIADALPWGLGILGVVLLSGGGYWYWRLGRQKPKTKTKQRGRRSQSPTKSSSPTKQEAIYCHQCGKRAAGGDRYCRACGTKLRMP